MFRGGGGGGEGCCDQVPCPCWGGGEGGVVTRSHVHVPGGGGEGGVVTRSHVHVPGGGGGGGGGGCCDQVHAPLLPPPPPPGVEVTHGCENITFARFATRAVIRTLNNFLN